MRSGSGALSTRGTNLPWERCLNGLLFVTFGAVPLKFNKYYVIKKLADIFFLSLLASLIQLFILLCNIQDCISDPVSTEWSLKAIQSFVLALFQSTTAYKIDSEHIQDYTNLF